MFNTGDFVKLNYVTEQDTLHSRYIGEVGVFQGYDEDGYAQVRFKDWSLYLVDKESISLEKKATLQSIFYAYCHDGETDLINAIENYINGNAETESIKKKDTNKPFCVAFEEKQITEDHLKGMNYIVHLLGKKCKDMGSVVNEMENSGNYTPCCGELAEAQDKLEHYNDMRTTAEKAMRRCRHIREEQLSKIKR